MPYSSVEISAMAGAFQQQSMSNMQYAGMIGQGSFRPGMQAEGAMGGLMNRAYSTGAPLIQGVMGMAGIDPFSLGMKAATSVWGAGGGVGMAGAAGIGAAGMAAGGLAVAGYMGNQVYTGAQQQQGLNNMLRMTYPGMSPYGQGMSRSDMGMIGSTIRSQTHQAGPGGEVVGFNELAQLAGNMGRMGMGQGIKDAQQFSSKFREMLSACKTIANELGTTLEGAQQFFAAQRSSGIFKTNDAMKFAMGARSTALSGGLALSEVTSMANIGSQVSRSMGGLGRQGAFGGMRAIGQIGSAMQVGALSEEDIYNATGLTGADGRQAMATGMMENSGRFLRSSKGRHFLASVAGKNGQLDEGSVQNWLMGGMDVGETRAQGQANLGKVGRANFIRNEGRLRGAVLERFGAMAPTMALSQWASGKGIDINNMDDRSMLFAQRQLGMGRDELDSAVKMASNMPEILRHQRLSGGDDEYGRRVAAHQRGHGIEGMRRRLEQIREGVQGKLQQVGSDIFTSGSDMIEQWFNKMSGVYERRLNADVDEVWKSAKMGGRGAGDLHRMLSGASAPLSGGAAQRLLAMGGGGGGSGDVSRAFYDKSREGRFAAMMGAGGQASSEVSNFVKGGRDFVRDAYTSGLAGMEGEHRISEFGKMLHQRAEGGDAQAKAMYASWKKGSANERASMLGSIEKESGISDKVQLGQSWELPEMSLMKGSFSTVREGDVAIGKQVLGSKTYLTGGQSATSMRGAASIFGSGAALLLGGAVGGLGLGEELANKVGGVLSGGESLSAAAGGYLRSKRGMSLVSGMMSGDKGSMDQAADRIQEIQMAGRKAGGLEHLADDERAEFNVLGQARIGQKYNDMLKKGAGPQQMAPLLEEAEKTLGMGKGSLREGDLRRFRDVGQAAMAMQARDQVEHLSERAADEMGRRGEAFQAAGVAHRETVRLGGGKPGATTETLVLNKKTREQLEKETGVGGRQAAEMALTSMDLTKELGKTTDPAKKAELLEQIANMEGQRYDKISELSTSQKKSLARRMVGTDVGSEAGESLMREQRMKSLVRSQGGGKKGEVGAIASQLGLHLDKEQLEGLKGKSGKELTDILASMTGDTSDAFKKDLGKAVDAMKSGKVGQSADLLQKTIEQSDEKTKKKIKEGRDGGEDPVVGAIKASGQKQEGILKLIASNTGSTADQISKLDKSGSPEEKKK